jgi:hypothetical protein
METQIAVPVPTRLFLDLFEFLRQSDDPRDPVDIVAVAIEYWLDNASWKPELLSKGSTQGYQWKSLFLPDGTEVRMHYKGAYKYAKVEGDRLIYDGQPTRPGALVNRITGSSRNAWRDLWIKRPADLKWRLAQDYRHEVGGEIAD